VRVFLVLVVVPVTRWTVVCPVIATETAAWMERVELDRQRGGHVGVEQTGDGREGRSGEVKAEIKMT
jgi:hypothetical protein